MNIAIVFFAIIILIGVVVYLASMSFPAKHCNPGKNVICLQCWGLLELNCGCPKRGFKDRYCKCAEPRPFAGE